MFTRMSIVLTHVHADALSKLENGVTLLTNIINSLFDPVIAIVTEYVQVWIDSIYVPHLVLPADTVVMSSSLREMRWCACSQSLRATHNHSVLKMTWRSQSLQRLNVGYSSIASLRAKTSSTHSSPSQGV